MAQQRRFPFFWEIDPPAGAEGWERMYPISMISHPGARESDAEVFYVQNKMHNPRVVHPFDTIVLEGIQLAAGQYNSRIFTVPSAMGMRERIHNGYRYLSPVEIDDPGTIAARAESFGRRAGYYYENWDSLAESWRVKVLANIEAAKAIRVLPLPDVEAEEVVTEGRGTSSGYILLAAYQELISRFFLMWQYHFEMVNIAHAAFGAFSAFCTSRVPGTTGQTVGRMVAGQELMMYRPEQELRLLAEKAVELDLAEVLRSALGSPDALAVIAAAPGGPDWLAAFDAAKDPWFYFSEGGNLAHDEPSWIDDLTVPLSGIRHHIDRIQRGEMVEERPAERLRAEAEEIIRSLREALEETDRAQFDKLLAVARTVLPFTQDHSFYGQHWFGTIFWQKVRIIADVLVARGLLADPSDLYLFHRHEVAEMVTEAAISWAVGVDVQRAGAIREEAVQRRRILAVLQGWSPTPAVGPAPAAITNPLLVSHVGVTTDVVNRWLDELDGTEATSLTGVGASPGVVEGACRIVRSADDVDQVREGEILVCETTNPSWGPVFPRLAGLVSDSGGMMSHSAVVTREYRIPSVVGCARATSFLQTGDQLRVDGDTGTVVVLARARDASLEVSA